jgi:hypothetical protein
MLNLRKPGLGVLMIAATANLSPGASVFAKANTHSQNAAQPPRSESSGQSKEAASSPLKDIFDFDFFKSKVCPFPGVRT